MPSRKISLRPAFASDREWLFALKCATMRDYVATVYGWDEAVQRQLFDGKFDPRRIQIIQVDECDAGLLEVEEKDDHVFLARIEILPSFQGTGVGASVIRSILKDAETKGKSVLLQVLRPNPARRLYERLGFSVCGETATHFQMRKDPGQSQ